MQNREVAENVIETLFDVAEKLCASVNMTDACSQEGKISKEEANAWPLLLQKLRTPALTDLPQRHGRRLPDWHDVTLIAGGQMNAQRSAITR